VDPFFLRRGSVWGDEHDEEEIPVPQAEGRARRRVQIEPMERRDDLGGRRRREQVIGFRMLDIAGRSDALHPAAPGVLTRDPHDTLLRPHGRSALDAPGGAVLAEHPRSLSRAAAGVDARLDHSAAFGRERTMEDREGPRLRCVVRFAGSLSAHEPR
jgi:hypothetical protein